MYEEKKLITPEENSEIPEKRDYEEELLNLIKSDEPPERLKEELDNYHENDIASVLPELGKEEKRLLAAHQYLRKLNDEMSVERQGHNITMAMS